jgi:CheY-like chemotaxis protein
VGETGDAQPPDAAPAPGLARLLLAEDDPINADLLCEYLEVNGYTLVWVEDGVEAVQKATDLHPDLILMDVQMPRLDGLQAIQQIRRSADPELAATPIIALTAQAMHGDADRCLAAGASTYISKPFRVVEVLRVIQSYLRQGRPAGLRAG